MSLFDTGRVLSRSADFLRINALPRRTWDPSDRTLADAVTALLRTPGGRMALLPVQAQALHDLWTVRGLFGDIGTGCGKTLITLLCARVLNAKRPVLICKAGLDNSGRKAEILEYARHWQFPVPRVVHFEKLSTTPYKKRPDGSVEKTLDLLDEIDPDLVVIDESHLFKNPKAARTKRMRRFRKAHPDCVFVAMTGTSMKRSIKDYAHVVRWCLGDERAPVPVHVHALDEFADALDERIGQLDHLDPGPLLEWADEGDIERFGITNAARRGFQRRFAETPGIVVASLGEDLVKSKVVVRELRLDAAPPVREAYNQLRKTWTLPDGTELVDGLEFARHARTLALGYWLKWRDPAPQAWRDARKAFFSRMRSDLAHSRTLDSPKEWCLANPDAPELKAWIAVKDTYEPVTVPVWISGEPLAAFVAWLKGGGVAFCDNTVFGEALAQVAGVPYFGAGGLNSAKVPVDQYRGKACVVSNAANRDGRNLQHYNRMLITAPVQNGLQTQQTLARLWRLGQDAATVDVTIAFGCSEHRRSFWQAYRDCEAIWHAKGTRQILLEADLQVTPEFEHFDGPEWA